MKALIAYASWFGHNRAIAKALAQELANQRVAVICAPVSKITVEDVVGLDLLVLGTYTHAGHANRRLRRLCDAIPRRRLEHMDIAIFGTQIDELQQAGKPGGVDDLEAHLEERGVDVIAPPLRIGLRGTAAFLPWQGLGEAERRQIRAFSRELLEACVPEPLA
jgi:menaquinone-dependent protoporphyrinogen IX oxidase